MKNVAVIDYGMGNLHSVAKAVESLDSGVRVSITPDAATILSADRIIFPGVGAIRDCMAEIRRLGVDEIVREALQSRPVLAICVGMQALMDSSEENGHVDCMSVLPGRVKRFGGTGELLDSDGSRLKVPHMGWNTVSQRAHPLWNGIEDNSRFYFVHSYHVEPEDDSEVYGVTEYGHPFAVAMGRQNLFAVQFHPEKSQHAGLRLLGNFLQWHGQTE